MNIRDLFWRFAVSFQAAVYSHIIYALWAQFFIFKKKSYWLICGGQSVDTLLQISSFARIEQNKEYIFIYESQKNVLFAVGAQ